MALQLLQQWECIVTETHPHGWLSLRMHDLTDPSRPEEAADIHRDLIPEQYRDLIAPGAVCYWSIVRETSVDTRSVFVFPRIPITQAEIDAARVQADDLRLALGWEGG